MTDSRDDSDLDSLSNEIVRALGKELRRLRASHRDAEARIHDFEANYLDLETKYGNLVATAHDLDVSHEALMKEHAGLKARRTELEKENERLRQELDGTCRSLRGIKVEREEPCILTAGDHYDQMKRALDESTKRREEEKLEYTRIVEGLQDKIASAAEERKLLELELKQSKRALILARSTANEESDSISNAEPSDNEEATVACRPSHDTSDCENQDVASDAASADGGDSLASSDGEEDETLSPDDDALNDTESHDEDVFDPPSFLSCKPGRNSSQPGWRLCLPPGPDGQVFHALRETLPLSVVDHTWTCVPAETTWSSSKTRCLLVFPSQRYNTSSGNHTYYGGGDRFSVGEARDLFYRLGRGWFYCGTFRCVGRSTISSNRISHFFTKGRENIFNTIVQRTAGSSQDPNKEVRNMYLNEELFIDCCGLEKIGKNRDIVRTLRAVQPQSNGNGRKRPSQHEDGGNRKKRKYC